MIFRQQQSIAGFFRSIHHHNFNSMTKAKQKSKATDKYQLITDQICQLLETGVKPWHKPWKGGHNHRPFQNLITHHIYTGSNLLWCMISNLYHGYESPYYVTFLQAKQQGWKIKEGSKSTWIRFAGTGSKEIENESGETTEEYFSFAKWNSVFSTDCIDDTDADLKMSDFIPELNDRQLDNPDRKIVSVDEFISNTGATIYHGGNRAFYQPRTDEIHLPEFSQFTNAEKYYATTIHELGHWTGHETRLNREGINSGSFGSETYAFEELIAELSSAFIGNCIFPEYVAQDLEHHASYLNSWLAKLKKDDRAFFKAVSQAQKAADYLLERGKDTVIKSENHD